MSDHSQHHFTLAATHCIVHTGQKETPMDLASKKPQQSMVPPSGPDPTIPVRVKPQSTIPFADNTGFYIHEDKYSIHYMQYQILSSWVKLELGSTMCAPTMPGCVFRNVIFGEDLLQPWHLQWFGQNHVGTTRQEQLHVLLEHVSSNRHDKNVASQSSNRPGCVGTVHSWHLVRKREEEGNKSISIRKTLGTTQAFRTLC
jgi:hypothetical protein